MGTNYNGEEHGDAVIPKVMDTIFSKVETMKESTEFLIRVSFIEVSCVKLQIICEHVTTSFLVSYRLSLIFADFQGRCV